MKPKREYFTPVEAARILKLTPQRVRVLLAKGRLQGYQAVSAGGRVTWRVHLGLHRRPAKAGRPRTSRRGKAASMDGGSEAKP